MKKVNFKHPCKNCISFPVCMNKIKPGTVFHTLTRKCELFYNYFYDCEHGGNHKSMKAIKTYKIYKIKIKVAYINKYFLNLIENHEKD